jgi:hypothetical protein
MASPCESKYIGFLGDRPGQPVTGNFGPQPVPKCHIANQSAKIGGLWESLHDQSCPRLDGHRNLAVGLIAACGRAIRYRKLGTCVWS